MPPYSFEEELKAIQALIKNRKIFFDSGFQTKINALLKHPNFFASPVRKEIGEIYWHSALNAVAELAGNSAKISFSNRTATLKNWQTIIKTHRRMIWEAWLNKNLSSYWQDPTATAALVKVQLNWAKTLKDQLKILAEEIDKIIEAIAPNCRPVFLWLARGSLARGDVAPYSDIESAVVVEQLWNNKDKEFWYLWIWWHCLAFEIELLGENNEQAQGLHLDTTLFHPKSLFTPNRLPSADEEPFLNQYSFLYGEGTDLCSKFRIAYDKTIVNTKHQLAIKKLTVMLDTSAINHDPNHPELATILGKLNNARNGGLLLALESHLKMNRVSIKKDLLSHLNWFVLSLGYGHLTSSDMHPLEIINALEKAQLFSPSFWGIVKDFWGKLQYLRCYTQWQNGCDSDKFSLLPEDKGIAWLADKNILQWLVQQLWPFYESIHVAAKHSLTHLQNQSSYAEDYLVPEYHPSIEVLLKTWQTFDYLVTPDSNVLVAEVWQRWLESPQQKQFISPLLQQLTIGWRYAERSGKEIFQKEEKLISDFLSKGKNALRPYWQSGKILSQSSPGRILCNRDISYQPSLILTLYKTSAFYEHANLPGVDLSNSRAFHTSFNDANLIQAKFQNGDFNHAGFLRADISYANAENATFDDADMQICKAAHVNFSSTSLKRVNLMNARLTDVIWSNADLTAANLSGAEIDLSRLLATAKSLHGLILIGKKSKADKQAIKKFRQNFKEKNKIDPIIITTIKELCIACKETSLEGLNLSHMIFDGETFSDTTFTETNLKKTKFIKSFMSKVIFRHSKLENTHFNNVKLNKTSFDGNDLHNVELENAEGEQTSWKGARLTGCKLSGHFKENIFENAKLVSTQIEGNLTNANFTHAKFEKCELHKAQLEAANFSNTTLKHSKLILGNKMNFSNAAIERVEFEKPHSAEQHQDLNFSGTTLDHCKFDAPLKQVNFSAGKLSDCKFKGNLEAASFAKSTLNDVSFIGVKLKTCHFVDTKMEATAFHQSELIKPVFKKMSMHEISFYESTLNMATFSDCDLTKADFRKSKIENLQFNNCKLEGANFEDATLQANLCGISTLKDVSFKNTVLLEATLMNTAGEFVDLTQAANLEGAILPKDYLDKLAVQKPIAYANLMRKKIALPSSKNYQEQVAKYEIRKKESDYSLATNAPPAETVFKKHLDSDSNNEQATDAIRKKQFMDMLWKNVRKGSADNLIPILSAKEITYEDINARLPDQSTLLHIASFYGHENVVVLLIANKINIDAIDNDKQTALHLAVLRGHEGVVKQLLKSGANKEAIDKDNNTALHLAAASGKIVIVKILIVAGANLSALTGSKNRADRLAEIFGYNDIAKLLKMQMQKVSTTNQQQFSTHYQSFWSDEEDSKMNEEMAEIARHEGPAL